MLHALATCDLAFIVRWATRQGVTRRTDASSDLNLAALAGESPREQLGRQEPVGACQPRAYGAAGGGRFRPLGNGEHWGQASSNGRPRKLALHQVQGGIGSLAVAVSFLPSIGGLVVLAVEPSIEEAVLPTLGGAIHPKLLVKAGLQGLLETIGRSEVADLALAMLVTVPAARLPRVQK